MEKKAAVSQLYERISSFVRARVSNEQDAQDLVQEIFLKMKLHLDTLNSDEKVLPWLFSIARNQLTDFYRKRSRPVPWLSQPEQSSSTESPAQEDVASWIVPFMQLLPPSDKQVLELIEFQSMTQKEAAEKLGLSLPALKSRHLRAKKKLRQLLESCCQYAFDQRGQIIDYQKKKGDCC